jgi:hypothetical protein
MRPLAWYPFVLAAMALAVLPLQASAQIYGAQCDSGDIYTYVDTVRTTVNPMAQIPPMSASQAISRDCGCDLLVAGRDGGEEIATLYRLNPATQVLTAIDTLDSYDEPKAICRGLGLDMYIMVGTQRLRDGERAPSDPYIGWLEGGLAPVDTVKIYDNEQFDLFDMQAWRYGDKAGNLATLERKNDGVYHWWDIGQYEMTVEETLELVGYRFGDHTPPETEFPAGLYSMNSIAITQSGDILMASDDSLYLVDDAGDWTAWGDGNGAVDLEVGADGMVYALDGTNIRRYDNEGSRILPDLTAPNPMCDLTIDDYVFTPSGGRVLIGPHKDIRVVYEESVSDGLTSAIVETTSARTSPGGSFLPPYAEEPGESAGPFTYVSFGTDIVYKSLIQADVLLEGSRLFFASGAGDTFRDFTIVGSIDDARGTIPRFTEMPCPGSGKEGRPATGPTEVVLVEDSRSLSQVSVYKFWRLELAMAVPETLPPCPWGALDDLRGYVDTARGHYDLGEYGSALAQLALMNAELRALAGWCVPESSAAPLGNLVGSILAHSKTLMFSIQLEWEEDPTGAEEARSAVSLAVTTPAQGQCRMAIHGPAGARATLKIYDVSGRLVSTVYDGRLTIDGATAVWDGTDSTGSRAASGVYFARAEAGGQTASSKLVYVR